MEDFGWLILIIAVWALVYAFVVDRRRRRDLEESGAKLTLLGQELENLSRHVEKLQHVPPELGKQLENLSRYVETLQHVPPDSAVAKPAPIVASTAAAPSPSASVCAKCGYKLQPGYEFCIRCGARVAKAAEKPGVVPAGPTIPAAPPGPL